MALVQGPYFLNVTFADSAGDETTRRIQIQGATDADAKTNATAVVADLVALSDAVVKGWTLCITFLEDAFALPAGNVNVEEAAELTLQLTTSPNKHAVFSVPAPKIGMFAGISGPNRNVVDTADVDTLNLVNDFNTGAQALISDGEAVETGGIIKGKRVHYRSRKG